MVDPERAFYILVAMIAIIAAVRANSRSKLGVLQLENRLSRGADTAFTGKYVSLRGDGIQFHTNRGYLSVTTLDDKPVFFASMDQLAGAKGFGYMKVYEQHFAYVDNKAYALSRPVDVQTLLSHSHRKKFVAKLQEDDHRAHAAVAETSMEDLAKSREAALMIEASFVLGKEYGFIGRDNPEVLPLYGIAMQLAAMRRGENVDDATVQRLCGDECPSEGCKAQSADGQFQFCRPEGSQGECPPCRDNNCFGMCGRRCCCWEWVCGDCCWYQYCHDHDICCEKQGFLNPWNDCLDIPELIRRRVTSGCTGSYVEC